MVAASIIAQSTAEHLAGRENFTIVAGLTSGTYASACSATIRNIAGWTSAVLALAAACSATVDQRSSNCGTERSISVAICSSRQVLRQTRNSTTRKVIPAAKRANPVSKNRSQEL